MRPSARRWGVFHAWRCGSLAFGLEPPRVPCLQTSDTLDRAMLSICVSSEAKAAPIDRCQEPPSCSFETCQNRTPNAFGFPADGFPIIQRHGKRTEICFEPRPPSLSTRLEPTGLRLPFATLIGPCQVSAVSSAVVFRQHSLLLIAEQSSEIRLIVDRASKAGWRTIVCRDMAQARIMLGEKDPAEISAVILDEAAGHDPSDAITELKGRLPQAPVLLITASAPPRLPINALRAGASDYLTRPIAPERLYRALRTASTRVRPHEHALESFAEKFDGNFEFAAMVGSDSAFRAALAQAAICARGHGHVVLEGESGTGKNMLARAIHAASPRAGCALKVVNGRGQGNASLDSFLFGHTQGAFVGAFEARPGILQECDGGTIILDEVNRLPRSTQERLAAALVERRLQPMGAHHSFRLDVRIIAVSNPRLGDLVASGKFSQELYEALAVNHIALPPLRDRSGDIPLLARHFLAKFRESSDLREITLTDEALSFLGRFHWPGNVRQLQAVLVRAAAFSSTHALTTEDFAHMAQLVSVGEKGECPPQRSRPGGIMLFGEDGELRSLTEIETDIIRLAIGHYRGRMSEVARRLGIGRSTLYRKLGDLGMESKQN